MLFPDETNLRHVASALWANPNGISQASVIIGAGFSKNAMPTAGSEKSPKSFPSWAELTDIMVDELYSHEDANDRRKRKSGASGGVSNALRIAEEYEAARGRGQLDSLLKKAIPDLDFEPSVIHNALCELPWADVLTTNYDTLLERAARTQLGRKYQPVLSQQDIPTTQQPRIIKLHGSFPESKQPFVITEEDFRTYESAFPAMVNLAQQCLAEKTCCLVGFSGDDPNFLRWSGWVRDVLGHSHMQPVYLVGLHDHSPSQKSLLDRRHVHTIDLSPLFPQSKWPNISERHGAAVAWFIEALKALKPPEITDWPQASTEAFTTLALPSSTANFPKSNAVQFQTEYAQPHSIKLPDDVDAPESPENFHELPEAEQHEFQIKSLEYINKRNHGHELDQRITAITAIWRNNRSLYPGWLSIPWSNQKELVEKTEVWASVIPDRAIEQSNQEKAIRWLRELAWRLDCALQPWSTKMISTVESCISFDDFGSDGDEYKIRLALELLRAFREDGQSKKFLSLKTKLSSLQSIGLDGRDFVCQQSVLFHLENWRIKEALAELQSWDTSTSSAIWKARKAALLGEFRPDMALNDALQALTNLQNSPDLSDLYTRSREANVLWLVTVLTDWDQKEKQDYHSRRRVIQRKLFDAFNFEERLNETLQDRPRIDLDTNDQQDRRVSKQVERAYSMRRYIEQTAGLISRPGVTVYANRIKNAVPWMAISDPEEALRLSVRHRSSSDSDCSFPSHMLAALGREAITDQILGVTGTISFLVATIGPRIRHRSDGKELEPSDLLDEKNRNSLLRAAIVHGHLLWPVLNIDQRTEFVEVVLEARAAASSFEWQTLNKIEEALHDILQDLPLPELSKFAPALVLQPLSGVDGFPRSPLEKRDIIVSALFKTSNDPRNVDAHDPCELQSSLTNLLKVQDEIARFELSWTATLRLAFAAGQGLLSGDQIETFTSNLERQLDLISADLQAALSCKAFHPADLLEISVGDRERYRSDVLKIVSQMPWPKFLQLDEQGKATSIRHLAPYKDASSLAVELTVNPWASSQIYFKPSDWSSEQVMSYLSQAAIWLEEEATTLVEREKKHTLLDPCSSRGQLTWRFERICSFCNNVVLVGHSNNQEAIDAASELTSKIYELLPHFVIKYAPSAIHSGLVSAVEMANRVRKLYAGSDSADKFNALMAVLVWATSAKSIGISPPPSALVTEFAVIIRTRREPDLGWALDIARILLKHCGDLIEPVFYDDVLLGLSYLAEETNPAAPASSALAQKATLTDLRVSSLELLAQLPQSGQRDEVISKWIKQSGEEVDWKVFEAMKKVRPQ